MEFRHRARAAGWALAFGLAFASGALAQAPNEISYQGRLLDDTGQALPGPVDIVVRIWGVPLGGSSPLYQESHLGTALQDGVFTLSLGSGTGVVGSLDAGTFSAPDRYLEIEVDGELLGPRQPFTSVPYAFVADTLEGKRASDLVSKGEPNAVTFGMVAPDAVDSVALGNGSVTSSDIADGAVGTFDLGDLSVTNPKIAPNTITADKLVDGAGSGLDADQLDGLEASDLQRRYRRVIVVDALGRGDFTDPVAAVASLAGATDGPFLIQILPGQYDLATGLLLPPNMHMAGSGRGNTILDGGPVVMSSLTELRSLTFNGVVQVVPSSLEVRILDVTLESVLFLPSVQGTARIESSRLTATPTSLVLSTPPVQFAPGWSVMVVGTSLEGSITNTPFPIPTTPPTLNKIRCAATYRLSGGLRPLSSTCADLGGAAVTTADIAVNAITSSRILDGEVRTADLADDALTSAKIPAGTIGFTDLDFSRQEVTFLLTPGTTSTRVLTCPVGSFALSGGWDHLRNQGPAVHDRLVQTYANGLQYQFSGSPFNSRSWVVGVYNASGSDVAVGAFVFCLGLGS